MGADRKTGWERENRIHFDEIVVNYDKYRWDYPAELLADAIQYAGSGNGKSAIEIGAGTGKATTPFLDAGYAVTAVEMGANMTEFLQDKFGGYKNFNVITSIIMKLYSGTRTYGADEYISLMDTMSDHRALPEKDRAALYAGIKDAILNHGGQLEMKFIFQLYMGRKLI